MKAKGERIERETMITWNEMDDAAYIWTASDSVYRQLLKRGYHPTEDGERHAQFEVAKRDIKLPRRKRKMSPEQRERLKSTGFSRKSHTGTAPKGPNDPPDVP